MLYLKKLIKAFLKNNLFIHQDGGGIAVIFALLLIPLLAFCGLAIDLGRAYYVHSLITGAVDAAAIAGAKAGGGTANMTQQAIAMFKANLPTTLSGSIPTPNVQVSADGLQITVTATGTLSTTFMGLFGQTTVTTTTTAQAGRSTQGAEVILALDNTGSMAGSPMAGEIDAARLLVNTLYGGAGNDTIPGLYVGVVPYSTTVNIAMSGFTPSSWLTAAGNIHIANRNLYPNIAPTSTSVGGLWMGCIETRTPPLYTSGMDATDTPPTTDSTKFTPFLYPSTMIHRYVFGQALTRGSTATSTAGLGTPPWGGTGSTRGDNDWRLNGTVPSNSNLFFGDNYQMNPSNSDGNRGVGPNLGCPVSLLPLTASQTTVLNKINSMKATFRGGTMINVGLATAWWMLSPRWRGLWPGVPSNMPQDYNVPLKIVVLMTDGQNQWYDWPTGVPGDPDTSHNYAADADYTGYGRLAEGRSGTTNPNNTIPVLNVSMSSMCTALKNNGVIMYTIVFNHNGSADDPSAQTALRNCASDSGKFFLTFTNQDLVTAFQNIGQSITNLTLTWPGKP